MTAKKIIFSVIIIFVGILTIYYNSNKEASHDNKIALSLYKTGMESLSSNNYQFAVDNFSQALKYNIAFHDAYLGRSEAYMKLGDYDKSLKDIDEYIKNKPTDYTGLYNRGIIYFKLNKYEDADNDFRTACNKGVSEACTELPKLTGNALMSEGIALYKAGNYILADDKFSKVIDMCANISVPEEQASFFFNLRTKAFYCDALTNYKLAHIEQDNTIAKSRRERANSWMSSACSRGYSDACNHMKEANDKFNAAIGAVMKQMRNDIKKNSNDNKM